MRTPKALFVGGGAGSWQIRGVQVAGALGGRCTAHPTASDWRWAEVVVLVKRAIEAWGPAARASGRPVIWDALDFWTQPDENGQDEAALVAEVRRRREVYRLTHVIGATQAMAEAIGGVYLPHHHWPGLRPEPVRTTARIVAYEGTPKYLGRWFSVLVEACEARGWSFRVNPATLTEADIVVALRDGKWDGDLCRRWKSGVKYANALAGGRPVIAQRSAAFDEIAPVGVLVETPSDMGWAFDQAVQLRGAAFQAGCGRAAAFSLAAVAEQYRAVLLSAAERAA